MKVSVLKSIIALGLISLTACVDSTSSSKDLDEPNSSNQALSQVVQSSSLVSSSVTQTSSSSALELNQNQLALLEFQSDEHIVAGRATIQSNENSTLEIQFHSDFIIDGGPDVFIFLSDQNYEDVETGAPQGEFFKIEKQIAVQNESIEGEMLYAIEGLTHEQVQKFKSIHFYCEMFGFIHWGGASITWK
ncbi:DM13 domain-containing protein [bacterium]|nr:DM13 domain-containing protein [bacterium]